jgi:hypothetical protein
MHPEHLCERLADNQLVGISVTRTQYQNMHAGIVYRWRGDLYVYHQAFDFDTRHERFENAVVDLGGTTVVVALGLRPDRQRAVAGFLNNLSQVNPQFPFSLKYDEKARIDSARGKLITSEGKGLNCVTFVLAVLQSMRIRLVEASTWPVGRPADLEAHQSLINALNKRGAAPTHLKEVAAEKGCTRIRPEEVAGSGYFTAWPTHFWQCEPASLHILKRISERLALPVWELYPEAN